MKPGIWLALMAAGTAGWFGALHFRPVPAPADSRPIVCYQSPMHPWVKSQKPGKCTVCGMDLVPVYVGGPAASGGEGILLHEGSARVIGMQTAKIKKERLSRTLRVSGLIGEDETRHGVICAPVEGRIDGLGMSCEGDAITRRQPMATIFSRTLLSAAAEYQTALGNGEPAIEVAKQRLIQFGLVWEQIAAIPTRQPDEIHFGLLAPLSGTIVKSYVNEGQYVREGEKLFEIADFTKMWFVFSASEQDLPLIERGQVVTVLAPSLPGQELKARVALISPNLDEASRSGRVRVVLENPDRKLRNHTFAQGTLEIEGPEVLAVPRRAVLWTGAEARVYVDKGGQYYEPRVVKLGRAGDTAWEIIAGLDEGEKVVLGGNLLLDAQAALERTGQGH